MAFARVLLSALVLAGLCFASVPFNPFPFVWVPFILLELASSPAQYLETASSFAKGVVVFFVISWAYGAPLLSLATVYWAALMSSIVYVPAHRAVSSATTSHRSPLLASLSSSSLQAVRSPGLLYLERKGPIDVLWPGLAALGGAWLGSCAMPLDWDRWWQAWPIPNTFGALAGLLLGSLAAAFA